MSKTPRKVLNRLESSVKAGLQDPKVIAMMRAAAILATEIELTAIYAAKKFSYLELQGINFYSTVLKCLELWSTEDGAKQLFALPGSILGLIYLRTSERRSLHETNRGASCDGRCSSGNLARLLEEGRRRI